MTHQLHGNLKPRVAFALNDSGQPDSEMQEGTRRVPHETEAILSGRRLSYSKPTG